jgi:8-oxo-dGTP diphosphatase
LPPPGPAASLADATEARPQQVSYWGPVKPLKQSISLVIEGPDGLLLVRRPDDDEELPGLWGLPAASLEKGESEHEAVRRAGRTKLGVKVRPVRPIGQATGERPAYRIWMRDWEAEILSGRPAVPQRGTGTQYDELRWGDATDLVPAARAGSLCARVVLESGYLGG